MEDVPKIRIEFVLGTKKLKEAVDDMIRQAIAIKGTRFHAAVALGISPATIINHLGPGIRTEPPNPNPESQNEDLARSDVGADLKPAPTLANDPLPEREPENGEGLQHTMTTNCMAGWKNL